MPKNYGKIIRNKRKKQELTQLDLAKKIGYSSAGVIVKAEQNEYTNDILKKIFAVLNAPVRTYTIYTDGGCEYNPGGPGGYGVVIIDEKTGETREISGGFTETTNNRMEIYAVIAALKNVPKHSRIDLYSDSKYVINTIEGNYKRNKNLDLWQRLDTYLDKHEVTTHWVQGHTGNRYNERCDELAAEGYRNAKVKDKGYTGKAKPEKKPDKSENKSEAFKVKIDADKTEKPIIEDVSDYAEAVGIKKECAENIKKFYEKDRHGFTDYKNLKTEGLDKWSGVPANKLRRSYSEEYDIVSGYIKDDKGIASALRWKGRGLTLYDAIRKVLVDREVNNPA